MRGVAKSYLAWIQRLYVQRCKRAPLMSLSTVALLCCSQWFCPSLM